MDTKITALYFSPTGTTKKVATQIARGLAVNLTGDSSIHTIDFTLPAGRQQGPAFSGQDVVIAAVPVYAGRVPNVLLPYLNSLSGGGAAAIAVVLYGNRNYDDALVELRDILDARGFKVVAGGAFIGEHSFSKTLGKDRPDAADLAIADRFAVQIAEKLAGEGPIASVAVKGNRPYRSYYMPKTPDGEAADIRKVKPKTNDDCIHCCVCVRACPMGSIDSEDVSNVKGICIKCGACIKKCPVQAKYYDDANYLRHKHELEVEFASRREPELFMGTTD